MAISSTQCRSLAGSGHVRFTPTTSPVKQLTPLNSLHLQMELLVSEETLRVPVFIPTEATKKMAAFSPCVPSALPPTHHSINPILVMLVRQESGALCFTPFLRSSLSSSSLIELACLLQDERPYYSFIPIGPSRSETATSERRGEAADGIDLNLKLWERRLNIAFSTCSSSFILDRHESHHLVMSYKSRRCHRSKKSAAYFSSTRSLDIYIMDHMTTSHWSMVGDRVEDYEMNHVYDLTDRTAAMQGTNK